MASGHVSVSSAIGAPARWKSTRSNRDMLMALLLLYLANAALINSPAPANRLANSSDGTKHSDARHVHLASNYEDQSTKRQGDISMSINYSNYLNGSATTTSPQLHNNTTKSIDGIVKLGALWHWLSEAALLGRYHLFKFHASFTFIRYAHCLRLVRIEVPVEIKQGQLASLKCLFDPENNKLQSLAWYKNGREFYRYQPYDRRSVLVFNRTGVHVDLSKSRNQTIVLTNTTSDTSGRYRCEVTANDFQTDNLEIYMTVVANSTSAGRDTSLILLIVATIYVYVVLSRTN